MTRATNGSTPATTPSMAVFNVFEGTTALLFRLLRPIWGEWRWQEHQGSGGTPSHEPSYTLCVPWLRRTPPDRVAEYYGHVAVHGWFEGAEALERGLAAVHALLRTGAALSAVLHRHG